MVSYYEWLQNKRSERWDLEEVEERLAKRMKRTYLQVSEYAAAKKCDWRMAAMGIALERDRQGLRRARDLPVAGQPAVIGRGPCGPAAAPSERVCLLAPGVF